MIREVRTEPLDRAAFAPFGDVVSAGLGHGATANQGTAVRFDWAARLASTRPDAKPNLAVFRSVARALPIEIGLLERHPCSTQVFLPLVCSRILVCVAPSADGGSPDLDGLRAFVTGPGAGVCYGVGVWHHPIVALDESADLAMLAWEDGGPDDCEEHPLASPIRLVEGLIGSR